MIPHETSSFDGETTVIFIKFLNSYERSNGDLELSDELRTKNFHHCLRDHALDIFCNRVEGRRLSLKDTVLKTKMKLNFYIKLETIAAKLDGVHILQFKTNDGYKEKAEHKVSPEIQKVTQLVYRSVGMIATKNCDMTLSGVRIGPFKITSSWHSWKLSYQQFKKVTTLLNSMKPMMNSGSASRSSFTIMVQKIHFHRLSTLRQSFGSLIKNDYCMIVVELKRT